MSKISRVLVLGSTGLVGHGISSYLIQKNFMYVEHLIQKKLKVQIATLGYIII